MTTSTSIRKKPFKNIMGKGENAGNHIYYPMKEKSTDLRQIYMSPTNAFNWDKA